MFGAFRRTGTRCTSEKEPCVPSDQHLSVQHVPDGRHDVRFVADAFLLSRRCDWGR